MPDAPNDPATPADDPNAQTPPWGDEFDAERAWQTILNLRQEVKDEKAAHAETAKQRDALQADIDAASDSSKTDAQKAAEKIAAAEKAAADANRALWVERALRKHTVDDDLVDLVTGDTEEAVLAIAERLAGRSKPKPADGEEEPKPSVPPRPAPALTPGHGGDAPAPFDPDAIATQARRG